MSFPRQSPRILLVLILAATVLAGCKTSGRFGRKQELGSEPAWVQVPPPPPPPSEDAGPETSKRWRFLSGKDTPESSGPAPIPTLFTPPPLPAPTPSGPAAYRLKPGDPVVIILAGPAGLDEKIEDTLDERGLITLRYIGEIKASGRTATELKREIEAEYIHRKKIYREVYATVHVPNKFYFIGGEVRQPGRFPLVGRVTLSQAIVAAGNFTEWARPSRIVIVRNNERIEVDFRRITSDPTLDVELKSSDVITVDRSVL